MEADFDLGGGPNGGAEFDEGENFDAFNDDTFGAAADEWKEEDHEELAKLTESELRAGGAAALHMGGNGDAEDFFDLGHVDADDGDCLEPPGESTINGEEGEIEKELAGKFEMARLEQDPAILATSSVPPGPPLGHGLRPNEFPRPPAIPPQMPPRPEFVDPAIMTMGQVPLPPRGPMMPGEIPLPQQPHPPRAMMPGFPPNVAPKTVEELEREMIADQQREQQQRQQQQQQQQQQQLLMHQQQMMMRAQYQQNYPLPGMPPPPQIQGHPHHHHPGGGPPHPHPRQMMPNQFHHQQMQMQKQHPGQHQHHQHGFPHHRQQGFQQHHSNEGFDHHG